MSVNSTRRNRKQFHIGVRLLLVGGVGAGVGIVLMTLLSGLAVGIGVAVASLSVVPALAGLGLLAASFVERREREGKPFV